MVTDVIDEVVQGLYDAQRVVALNKLVFGVFRLERVGRNVLAVELIGTQEGWVRFVQQLVADKFQVRTQGWRSLKGKSLLVQLYVSRGKPSTDISGRSPFIEGRNFFSDDEEDV